MDQIKYKLVPAEDVCKAWPADKTAPARPVAVTARVYAERRQWQNSDLTRAQAAVQPGLRADCARFTAENSEFRKNYSLACEEGVCFAALVEWTRCL
jgi:hypothetical protein